MYNLLLLLIVVLFIVSIVSYGSSNSTSLSDTYSDNSYRSSSGNLYIPQLSQLKSREDNLDVSDDTNMLVKLKKLNKIEKCGVQRFGI